MSDDLEQKLARLREQLERGEYTVDPDAVAQALLERIRLRAITRTGLTRSRESWRLRLTQNECSNPETETDEPSSATIVKPFPALTRPIHVTAPARSLAAAVSSIVRIAASGAQMHSS